MAGGVRSKQMFDDRFGYDKVIPEEIREVFMWLCQDLASLYFMWNFYKGLFGNIEDVALLTNYAQSSFIVIEEALRTSMVMAICRFNDPSIQQNNQNLSLKLLVQKCDQIFEFKDLYNSFQIACEPFVIYRNKRFGHRDLPTAFDYDGNILPGIAKNDVEIVLELAAQILNSVGLHFTDGEYHFNSLAIGGAENLLYWIKKGVNNRNLLNQ